MKKLRVGINGFGRIGRSIFRVAHKTNAFEVVAINELNPENANIAYLLKYDSTHGILDDEISSDEQSFTISSKKVAIYHENTITEIPWYEHEIDVVIDSTGSLKNVSLAKEIIHDSVKKVVFSDSPDQVDFTCVFGVNEHLYNPQKHHVISSSICDVVGTSPALFQIEKEFGIEHGFVQTMHPWLSYQNLMDNQPKSTAFPDKPWTRFAIGRAATKSLIPKNTSLVPALYKVLPTLQNKLNGMTYRVPTEIVSTGNAFLKLKKNTTTESIREFLKSKVSEPYFGYTEEARVSIDYLHHKNSCMIDGKWLEVINGDMLRMVAWYDNEWGYSSRLIDVVNLVGNS